MFSHIDVLSQPTGLSEESQQLQGYELPVSDQREGQRAAVLESHRNDKERLAQRLSFSKLSLTPTNNQIGQLLKEKQAGVLINEFEAFMNDVQHKPVDCASLFLDCMNVKDQKEVVLLSL